MNIPRTSALLLSLLLPALAAVPARGDSSITFTPGTDFWVDTARPGTQVVGNPLATKAPGISQLLVTWVRGGPDGVGHVIWARQLDTPGLTKNPERVLARVPDKKIDDVSLSAGWYNYALGWRTSDPVTRRQTIFARVFDLHLNPAGPLIRIEIPPSNDDYNLIYADDGPEVGVDDSGNLVVAWIELLDMTGLGRFDFAALHIRRFALDGAPGASMDLPAEEDSNHLALAVAPGGSFMAAWDQPTNRPAVRALLFGADNVSRRLFTAPGEDTARCLRTTQSPALAAGYQGFFVAFADPVGQAAYGNFGLDPGCLGIFGQLYDPSGQILREDFRIKRDSWSPIVRNNRDEFLVVWEGNPPAPGSTRQQGVYLHPYFGNGQSAGPDLFVQKKPVTGVAFEGGGALLVWPDKGRVRARYLTEKRPTP